MKKCSFEIVDYAVSVLYQNDYKYFELFLKDYDSLLKNCGWSIDEYEKEYIDKELVDNEFFKENQCNSN